MNGLPSLPLYATETLVHTWITIGMGLTMTITSFFAAFLTGPIGRNPLLFWSLLGSTVATAILTIYFVYLKQWIMFIGFCVISSIVISLLIMTLQAELFPTSTRALTTAITELTVSAAGFLCLKTYIPINNAFRIHYNFIIYSVLAAIGAGIALFLPETRRITMSSV